MRRRITWSGVLVGVIALMATLTTGVSAGEVTPRPAERDWVTPLLGLENGPAGHGLLVADAGEGIVALGDEISDLVFEMPGVSDVDTKGRHNLLVITAEPPEEAPSGATAQLYRFDRRTERAHSLANFTRFENRVNPDGAQRESNPYHLTSRRHRAFVADAAGNSIVVVNTRSGAMSWMATLPMHEVRTAGVKEVFGCPTPENPEAAQICELPPVMMAEAVPTAIEIGRDGAFYVSELIGFPAPPGTSVVRRIERGVRRADCGTDPRCTIVLEGFSSIVDLSFDSRGRLLVTEIDENGWLAAENGAGAGGTVNKCHVRLGRCVVLAEGLFLPTAAVSSPRGGVFATVGSLVPGQASVERIAG